MSVALLEKQFEFEAASDHLKSFRQELTPLLQKAQLSDKAIHDVTLAVNEAITNVIRHAYKGKGGPIKISYREYQDRIELLMKDEGVKFDPSKIPAPKLPPEKPGGLGLFLIQKLMDKAEYDMKCQNGNELLLTKLK